MEECFICFDNYWFLQKLACKHQTCYNCYLELEKCPFCRSKLIKINDLDYIYKKIKLITNKNDLIQIIDRLKTLKLSDFEKSSLAEKFSHYFSKTQNKSQILKYHLLQDYFVDYKMRLLISYHYSSESLEIKQLYTSPSIFSSDLNELCGGGEVMKIFKKEFDQINQNMNTGCLNTRINMIDTLETIVELENGIKMNLMQYYIYKYDVVKLTRLVSQYKMLYIAKCYLSLEDGMGNQSNEIYKLYFKEYDRQKILHACSHLFGNSIIIKKICQQIKNRIVENITDLKCLYHDMLPYSEILQKEIHEEFQNNYHVYGISVIDSNLFFGMDLFFSVHFSGSKLYKIFNFKIKYKVKKIIKKIRSSLYCDNTNYLCLKYGLKSLDPEVRLCKYYPDNNSILDLILPAYHIALELIINENAKNIMITEFCITISELKGKIREATQMDIGGIVLKTHFVESLENHKMLFQCGISNGDAIFIY